MMSLIAGLMASVTISFAAYHLAFYFAPNGPYERKKMMDQRLKKLVETSQSAYGNYNLKKTLYLTHIRALQSQIEQYDFIKNLACSLQQARVKIPAVNFLATCVGGVLLAFFITSLIGLPFPACVLASAGVGFVPMMYVKTHRARYLRAFEEQFPNSLNMLSNSLRAGNTVEVATEVVAKTAPEPAAGEFQSMTNEINLGQSFPDALKNLYRRIPSTDVKIFLTAVSIQSQTGGNLSEILKNLEGTIRERFTLRREIRVLSSEGKSSVMIMGALPFIVSIPQILMNKESFFAFAGSGFGKIWLLIAFGFQLTGFLWSNKITKIGDN